MTKCVNEYVAVRPFSTTAEVTTGRGGLASVVQSTQLVEVEVVFGNDKIPPGKGWVHGNVIKHPESTQVHDVQGQKVVLVPVALFRIVSGMVPG